MKNVMSAETAQVLLDGRATKARWRRAEDLGEPRGLASDDPRYGGRMSLLAIKDGTAIVAYEGDAALMAAAPELAANVVELQAQVADLTAQRDRLRETVDGRTTRPTPAVTKRTDTGETPENRRERAKMEAHSRAIAEAIAESLPEGIGFALLLFDFGEGGNLAWISNANREDMVRALREQLARFEAGMAGERTPPAGGNAS